jgi:exodeoxyribonuclease VII small subunit
MKGAVTELESSSFEDILRRLETVVETLEKGDLPLERSLEVFEEGVRLSRLGTKRLEDAESRVELLLSRDDVVATRPLEDEET